MVERGRIWAWQARSYLRNGWTVCGAQDFIEWLSCVREVCRETPEKRPDQLGEVVLTDPLATLTGSFPLVGLKCKISFDRETLPSGHTIGGERAWHHVGWLVCQDGDMAVLAHKAEPMHSAGRGAIYSDFTRYKGVQHVQRLAHAHI